MSEELKELFIVRLWDGMDGCWSDVTDPLPLDDANKVWNEMTDNGTHSKAYADIDYFRIFPADTRMHYINGREMWR